MKTRGEDAGMMNLRLLLAVTALAGLVALASCAITVREPVHDVEGRIYSEELYYFEAPPAPQAEVVVSVAPSPNHIWVGGYWTRHNDSWFWVHGRWAPRPHPSAVWVDGRWEKHPRGHVWVAGHWR